MKRLLYLLILIAVLIIPAGTAYSQIHGISFGAGMSSTQILGNNAGALPIYDRSGDSTRNNLVGGGFEGTQPGISFRVFLNMDSSSTFVIPFGIDYTFFDGLERIALNQNYIFYFRHSIDIPTLFLGLNYKIFKFPLANVRFYSGLEFTSSFINNENFYRKVVIKGPVDTVDIKEWKKINAFRMGGLVRLGVEGHIIDNLYINPSIAWGIMNLFGKDNNRYELLTPRNTLEEQTRPKESNVVTFNFSVLLQYKL